MLQPARIVKTLILIACTSLAACGGGSSSSTGGSVGVQSNGSSAGSRITDITSGYTIAGGVTGATGVSVKLMGLTANTTLTDSTGSFSFASVGTGSYTVQPTQTGRVFTPVSRAEAISSSSVTNVTFSAASSAAPTYTISGTVNGAVAAGVVMTLNGVNVGSTVTDLSGNYAFAGLVSGTYTVAAALPGYSFSTPLIISLDTQDSASNDFTSAASPGGLLQFTPSAPLPATTVGSAYSAKIVKSISGGTAPYHYQAGKLDDGTPPLGMIINPNGNLTGTANAAGHYDFTVCAVDDAGTQSTCQPTSITVTGTAGPDPSPNPGPTPAPSVDISASPATITAGNTSKLSWSAKNATACSATGGWSGSKDTSGSAVIAPNSTTTYGLSCAGAGGTGHASIAVSVRPVGTPGPAPVPTVTLNVSPATITSGSTADLTWSSTDASSCLASSDWAGTKADSGSMSVSPTSTATYTLTCTGAGGTAQTSARVTVNRGTPSPPPTAGTSWVYYNGTFDWPGDYSFVASANYNDTSGGPMSGGHDIKVTINAPWGGWQPYAQNWNFNSAPYTKLTFSLKPTVANQKWNVYFVKIHDIPVGVEIDPANYGPAPVVGQWATYTVPLADLGVQGMSIYKFCIHDQTGLSSNVWYVDNVGFVP